MKPDPVESHAEPRSQNIGLFRPRCTNDPQDGRERRQRERGPRFGQNACWMTELAKLGERMSRELGGAATGQGGLGEPVDIRGRQDG
ncbi:MAG: hypothetical protein JW999_05230 [Methanotrichaceae archaeon]|nr:hypothetical protein [Methanotrichaceae archaeon]